MPERRQAIHRSVTLHDIPTESKGKQVHLYMPTHTLADFRRAYPTGQFRCGSCGELWPSQAEIDAKRRQYGKDLLDTMEERWGPDTVISLALSHEHFPDAFYRQDPAPDEENQELAACPVLFTDGVRDEYIQNDDGRYEWLYGFVYRDARSPEGVYREVWYPTAAFLSPEEVPDAKT